MRAKAIAKYLDETKGAIPTSLILSAQKKSNTTFNRKTSKLKFHIINRGFSSPRWTT